MPLVMKAIWMCCDNINNASIYLFSKCRLRCVYQGREYVTFVRLLPVLHQTALSPFLYFPLSATNLVFLIIKASPSKQG